ncbi:MAG: hypothetical protein WC415_06410 [Patescibacteria group bacterium]|jgi:hypothetical protein
MENKNDLPADLEKEVIEKIAVEKIKPIARWKVILKNWLIWFLGGVSILFGSLAFSSILYFFQPGEVEIWGHSGANWKEFLLFSLPHFWLIFLILFLLVAWYYFRHTQKGYRYSLFVILAISVLASVLLGSLLYGAGMARLMDDFLGKQAPFYGEIINPRARFWLNPDNGRLGGLVINKKSDEEFVIYNRDLGEWQIETTKFLGAFVHEGYTIITVGEKISKNRFRAEQIFLPPLGGEFFRRGQHSVPIMNDDFMMPMIFINK